MAKILCIGDLHIKPENFNNILLLSTFIEDLVRKENVDAICVMGDILHTFEKIKLDSINLATTFFEKLYMLNVKLFIIIGNHDYANNEEFLSSRHAFNSLKIWKNTYVIDNVTEHKINGINFCFLPYVKDGRVCEALLTKNLCPPYLNIKAFFGHSDFLGTSINKISGTQADKWDESWPLSINGHLHNHEKIGENLIFVGTPMQHNFGDFSEKTISIFEFGDKFVERRFSTNLPKKYIVNLSCGEFLEYKIPEKYESIKIKINGEKKEIDRVIQIKNIHEIKDKLKIEKIYTDVFSNDFLTKDLKKRISFKERIHSELKNKNNVRISKVFKSIFS